MARQKKKVIQEVTLDAAEDAFALYNKCIGELQKIEGKMNVEITKVKEKFESRIAELQEDRDLQFEMLQAYAETNPELFEKKKSFMFTHGTIGFRTGTPKLSLQKGFKWDGVLKLVKRIMPSYVRIKEDVDKERILMDRNLDAVKSQLDNVGLKVEQVETFFVEPDLEEYATV